MCVHVFVYTVAINIVCNVLSQIKYSYSYRELSTVHELCANCCADIIIYVVSVLLCAILKLHNLINLLKVTHCYLSVEQRRLQKTESP